jgi:hypothetical protein
MVKRLDETKRLMGALVRMKPKPHEEMKLKNKPKRRARKRPVFSGPFGASAKR